jgi:hypothetical protein
MTLYRDQYISRPKHITFTSSTIGKPDPEGNHLLCEPLTLSGFTQNVKLDVQFGGIIKNPWSNEKIEHSKGFECDLKLNIFVVNDSVKSKKADSD